MQLPRHSSNYANSLTKPPQIELNADLFFFQPEFAHPWEVLHKKTSLTIASPKGGKAPLDQGSVKMFESDPVSKSFLDNQEALWTNTEKLADMVPRAGEFDAIFYVGGHGRMLTNPHHPPHRPFNPCEVN